MTAKNLAKITMTLTLISIYSIALGSFIPEHLNTECPTYLVCPDNHDFNCTKSPSWNINWIPTSLAMSPPNPDITSPWVKKGFYTFIGAYLKFIKEIFPPNYEGLEAFPLVNATCKYKRYGAKEETGNIIFLKQEGILGPQSTNGFKHMKWNRVNKGNGMDWRCISDDPIDCEILSVMTTPNPYNS